MTEEELKTLDKNVDEIKAYLVLARKKGEISGDILYMEMMNNIDSIKELIKDMKEE